MTVTSIPRPEWADPDLSDSTSSTTADGGAFAQWIGLLVRDGDVAVFLERRDSETVEGNIEQGNLEIAIHIGREERVAVRSTAELRKVAATLLNAADALDASGAI